MQYMSVSREVSSFLTSMEVRFRMPRNHPDVDLGLIPSSTTITFFIEPA